MDKNNLVVLKGSGTLLTTRTEFKPNTFYRCLPPDDTGVKDEYMVYGETIPKQIYDNNFELAHDRIMRDWETLGMLNLSFTKFKELADVHEYVTRLRQRSTKLRIILFRNYDFCYGFYPSFAGNKAQALREAHNAYLAVCSGDMSTVDNRLIQLGNRGIPLSYGDLTWR